MISYLIGSIIFNIIQLFLLGFMILKNMEKDMYDDDERN